MQKLLKSNMLIYLFLPLVKKLLDFPPFARMKEKKLVPRLQSGDYPLLPRLLPSKQDFSALTRSCQPSSGIALFHSKDPVYDNHPPLRVRQPAKTYFFGWQLHSLAGFPQPLQTLSLIGLPHFLHGVHPQV
jgi:hypothetical protein